MSIRHLIAVAVAAYSAQAWAVVSVDSCRTITSGGSYALTQNLAAGAGPCLTIGASDVTLDLGGFTISGDGTQDGITISGSPKAITVRNGAIVNTRWAVYLGHTDGGVVQDLRIGGNKAGIVLLRGRAENNIIQGNAGNGIEGFEAISATGNVVVENAGQGIVAGPGSIVADNLVVDNDKFGILVVGNASATVTKAHAVLRRNVSRANGLGGIAVTCPALLVNNATYGNGSNGQANAGLFGAGCVKRGNLGF